MTDEHWLKVGDQAVIDAEGFLVVHGQKQVQSHLLTILNIWNYQQGVSAYVV